MLDFDAEGHLVGFDIDQASKIVNLSRLEAEALPITTVSLVGAQAWPGKVSDRSLRLLDRETPEMGFGKL